MKAAVVYVTGGISYAIDAVVSRDSVKRNNPTLPCYLATDVTGGIPGGYDGVIKLSPRRHPNMWYRDSTRYYLEAFNALREKYEALLFLDSDVYCDDNIDDMLEITKRFDLAAVHESNRHTCKTVYPIPNAFPEINIGVMLVSTNEHIHNLFIDWHELYENHASTYQDNDQGPLREALWINKLINMYVLPEEYNARWGFGCCVVSRVKFLHSRAAGPAPYTNEQAAREINATGGRRLFRPGGFWWKPVVGDGKG